MWFITLFRRLRERLGEKAMMLLFPALLLVLNIAAAVVCFRMRDWRRGVYWLASAVCIAMVAFR